ncbi:helix-turn-helix domain-containing protein [Streptomyces millisiae]|uniref:Helix-turn-helix transcriptional regulator n=1 Tax=Streptomyces millisiae TaxID=3075542 RepID=A0ABU2LLB9_9ACTN|nr:helix-turn-helix transcriptional regulator [Streptomyces sp. DSM 44918]MDT0318305.1 helix-turn-helix transcriptional regulator [Streptomyces sp. DSM 44918]
MVHPKELNPYLSPRAFYGGELRRLREGAGFSQDVLGKRVFCSGTYIGQFETAERRPQLEMSKLFDEIFGTGEHFQRLCKLVHECEKGHAHYYAAVIELTKNAQTICESTQLLVPGTLQTEDYARALVRAAHPYDPDEAVEKRVKARLDRQRMLEDPTAPELWFTIHEAAFRLPMGGPELMRRQLDRLLELGHDHHRVVLQVMPFSAGPHPFLHGSAALMTFPDAPPTYYAESDYSGQLIEEPALVTQYFRAYDHLRAAALSPKASLALIGNIANDLWAA